MCEKTADPVRESKLLIRLFDYGDGDPGRARLTFDFRAYNSATTFNHDEHRRGIYAVAPHERDDLAIKKCPVFQPVFSAAYRADRGRPGLPGGLKVKPICWAKFFTAS
jgi:hypothetical protein